jgi:hypothetical protein
MYIDFPVTSTWKLLVLFLLILFGGVDDTGVRFRNGCCCCQVRCVVIIVVKYYTADEGRNGEWLLVDFATVMNIEDWGSEVIGYLFHYGLKVLLSEGGGEEV